MPSVIQEPPVHPLETYIRELRDIRASGTAVAETSYYGPLANLLNEVGKTLKPRVRCIINIKNQGAGIPDGGLFTRNQFQKASDAEPLPGLLPARGAIEVKGTVDDASATADSEQVARYWETYGQVLVTNYRDFILIGQSTCNIHLNDVAYWKNIPTRVWNYRIGGYQVIKKWLSYRESKVLGRSLTVDEVREVTNMARRIAAILLLEPALDENYEKVKSSTYKWERSATS